MAADATPSPCLDPDTASAYAAGGLGPQARAEVEAHIDGCTTCRHLISVVATTHWSQSSPEPDPGGVAANAGLGAVLPRGTRIGPFELERPLEAGGMGLVYVAHDPRLGRTVALKGVREPHRQGEQLLREARMMARLSHPNVVPVYDVLEAHGQIFLAMELVVGQSVRTWLEAAPRSWQAVVDVFLEAGRGLAAAHAAGIVHADVKPANILLGDDGRARVTDFGLAQLASGQGEGGPVVGTPAYMAPEQRAGAPADPLADQYAFCVSLHEALHGALPGQPPRLAPRLPGALKRVLTRGLEPDPARRYPSMQALLRALAATRRSARLRVVVAVASLGAALLAYLAGGQQTDARLCEGALASPWTARERHDVEAAFLATGLDYAPSTAARLDARLGAWAADFDGARRAACGWSAALASRRDPAQVAARLACLADLGRQAKALVNALREADATVVRNSQAAVELLPPVATCEAAPPAPALPPRTAAAEAQDALAQAWALLLAAKFEQALPLAKRALEGGRAAGDEDLTIGALLVLGQVQARVGEFEAGDASLREVLYRADRAHDDRRRAKAWMALVQAEFWRGHYEQLVRMREPALGAAERVGDEWVRTEILLMLGGALDELGRPHEAQPLFEEAVALRTRIWGPDDRRVASALSAYGNALSEQGALDGGVAAHAHAVEIAERALGQGHPNVGILHNNLGDDYLYGLEAERAVKELELGTAILQRTRGPKQRDLAVCLTDLGFAYLEAARPADALATFERAHALWLELNPQHPLRAQCLLGRYQAQVALGRGAEVALLEAALPIAQRLPPFERGRTQLALGLALADPARARTLVKAAREGLATSSLPLIRRELARADAWLAAHGGPP